MSPLAKNSKVLNYDGPLESDWDFASYAIIFCFSLAGVTFGTWYAVSSEIDNTLVKYFVVLVIAIISMTIGYTITHYTTGRRAQQRDARLSQFITDFIQFAEKRYGIILTQTQAKNIIASSKQNKLDVIYSRQGLHYPVGDDNVTNHKKVSVFSPLEGFSIEIEASAIEGRDWRLLLSSTGKELDRA